MSKKLPLLLALVVGVVVFLIVWCQQSQKMVPPVAQQGEETFTLAEVATHENPNDCYVAINDDVYDVTEWIAQHPGGDKAILGLCGTDGSAAFTKQHSGQPKPEAMLASFNIGTLSK